MLKLILAFIPLAMVASGQQQPVKTAPYKAPVTKTKVVAKPTATSAAKPSPTPATPKDGPIQGIPAAAVQMDETTYRYQEKDPSGKPGKVWLYRRTPFGVSRIEENKAADIGKVLPAPETPATVTDLGDSYRFERSGPFGTKVWTKKKSELTPEERAITGKSDVSGVSSSSPQKAAN